MMRTRPLLQISIAVLLALATMPPALGVGSGGTGARIYARAALSIAGGVVVNGITFDPSQAQITINGQGRTADDLRPGMVAGVNGYVRIGLDAGDAQSIHVARVTLGTVLGVGSGGTGYSLNSGVEVDPRTDVVIEGCATPSNIVAGTALDVYGYSDGVSGVVDATRIECISASNSVELSGIASAINPLSIVVNGVSVDVSNAQFVGFNGSIAAGDGVRVDGTATSQGIAATTVTFEPDVVSSNGEDAQIEDAISAMISPSVFIVDGFEVDATHAQISGGTAADLVVGRVVRVQGKVVNGIVKARSVEFDDGESGDDGSWSGGGSPGGRSDDGGWAGGGSGGGGSGGGGSDDGGSDHGGSDHGGSDDGGSDDGGHPQQPPHPGGGD